MHATPFSTAAVQDFNVTESPQMCEQLRVRLEPIDRHLCLGQDIRLRLHLPDFSVDAHLGGGVVGLVQSPFGAGWGGTARGGRGIDIAWAAGDLDSFGVVGAAACALQCGDSSSSSAEGNAAEEPGQPCSRCYKRVCPAGGGDCQGDVQVLLHGSPGPGGNRQEAEVRPSVSAPTVEGVFRACFYRNVHDFRCVAGEA